MAQPTPGPAWRQGEVMVLLKHADDAARLTNRSRQRTPAASHRLRRLAPAATATTAVEHTMQQLGTYELVPVHQPAVGAAARSTAASPQADLFGHVAAPRFTDEESDFLSRLFLLRYSAPGIDAPEAAALLNATEGVELAEPNLMMRIMAADDSTFVVPPDSVTTVTASRLDEQWALRTIRLTELWQQPFTKNLRIKIAIVDTGVDTHHPDLEGNISVEGYDFPRDTSDVVDFHGHGTHCAGIAAANGRGQVAGACPEALILPITVMDRQGMGNLFDIMLGVLYAVNHGAHFISMSLGGYGDSSLYQSIITLVARYSIVFAAAGNDGFCFKQAHRDLHGNASPHEPCIPAAYPGVIAVMSTDADGRLSSFSNFDCDGPLWTDSVSAPNYELRVPGRNILSTLPDGQYGYMTGTSMSCPLAVGAVARLCLSSSWRDVPHLVRTLIMTQSDQLDVMAALKTPEEQVEAATFRLETDSVSYTFVRLDSASVQLGDGIHPALTIAHPDQTTSLTLPNEARGLAVTTLAPHAFDGCTALQTLRLSCNISTIQSDALTGCTALSALYTATDVPPTCAAGAFSATQLRQTVSLNVINGFADPYAAAPVWRDFTHRRELDIGTGNRFTDTALLYPDGSDSHAVNIPTTYLIYNMDSGIGQVGAGEPAIDTEASGRLVLPDEVRSLQLAVLADEAFYGCQNLTAVQLPAYLQQIWYAVFSRCTSLTEMQLPDHVTYVGARAFAACTNLQTLTLSPQLNSIGNYAFAACPRLSLIVAPMTSPPALPENAFITEIPQISTDFDLDAVGDVYRTARLVVPSGCRQRYAEAEGWSLFRHIDEMTPDGRVPDSVQPVRAAQPPVVPATVYSLTGQRLSPVQSLPAGIYIVDGRKMVIK